MINMLNIMGSGVEMRVVWMEGKMEGQMKWGTTIPSGPNSPRVTRTRWRRVKTLGQHQVGMNLQSHAQHQLWISTWHIFHEFHKNNARLKLSCKFGESKCNPCWQITLTTSRGMDYVLNEHLDFKPTWSICNTISDNIVIQLIWKFQESNWNPDWFIASMDSFDTNHIFTNYNKNLGQYDQNAIPSQIMPCYSYPGNLFNLNEIPIELTC